MLGRFTRRVTVAAAVLWAGSSTGFAQWFPQSGYCPSCAPAVAPVMPAPVAMDVCNVCPQPVQVVSNPCPCLQPVTQTVFREVPVTKYKTVQRTVKKPVIRTVYEDRPVTAYRQVVETKTAEVPSVAYQTVTECQMQTVDQSRWQTVYQPVPKVAPCQYDPNPTLLGWMNRSAYAIRSALTPNYIRHRQFVPNVTAVNVPVTRTVAVPTTRQVTYNVARMVPYETTQRVAVNKVEYVDETVTAYEPYTEMQTVAVGTTTQYAFVPFGGTAVTAAVPDPISTQAANPTPIQSAENPNPSNSNQQKDSPDDLFNPISHPVPSPTPRPGTGYYDADARPAPAAQSSDSVIRVAGWRASRSPAPKLPEQATDESAEVKLAARR